MSIYQTDPTTMIRIAAQQQAANLLRLNVLAAQQAYRFAVNNAEGVTFEQVCNALDIGAGQYIQAFNAHLAFLNSMAPGSIDLQLRAHTINEDGTVTATPIEEPAE